MMEDGKSHIVSPVPFGTRFSRDAFVGTARYYSDFRLPYPAHLLKQLCLDAEVTGRGRLVDLGCGPGRVSLPLSSCFVRVTAVDSEKEMIREGRNRARSKGIGNIRWYLSLAESFRVAARTAELVTIGEAFHRFDQRAVAERVRRWLKPKGCIALLWQHHPWQGGGTWHQAVRETMNRWAPIEQSARTPPPKIIPFEQVLIEAGFVRVERKEFIVEHKWTIDELIGFFYSTSILSRRVLGAFATEFEADLRASLLVSDARGQYPEDVSFAYIIGRSQ